MGWGSVSTCPIIPTPVPAARLGVIGLRGWMGTCEGCMRGASPRGPGMGEGDTRLSGGDRSRAPPRPCFTTRVTGEKHRD
jgi:hypothetical protein